MQHFAIIVAGGTGSRMKSDVPKQFMIFAGKPMLLHVLERFFKHDPATRIILVLPAEEIISWKKLVDQFGISVPHTIVAGGTTRFHSVRNGLSEIKEDGIVAIHDGVRPLFSSDLLKRCMDEAEKSGSSVPVIPVSDSLRRVEDGKNMPADRSQFFLVQTPQCFRVKTIQQAYKKDFQPGFTDDATVFEKDGHTLNLVQGETWNIKITYPEDLLVAGALYEAYLEKFRG